MGKFEPEVLIKRKGYATSKNQWIDELPPFFKKHCLHLIYPAKYGSLWASSPDDSGTDEEEEAKDDLDSCSDSSSDSDEDECYCTAIGGGCRYCF